jgi:transcriptional regulator NrdR family protein
MHPPVANADFEHNKLFDEAEHALKKTKIHQQSLSNLERDIEKQNILLDKLKTVENSDLVADIVLSRSVTLQEIILLRLQVQQTRARIHHISGYLAQSALAQITSSDSLQQAIKVNPFVYRSS